MTNGLRNSASWRCVGACYKVRFYTTQRIRPKWFGNFNFPMTLPIIFQGQFQLLYTYFFPGASLSMDSFPILQGIPTMIRFSRTERWIEIDDHLADIFSTLSDMLETKSQTKWGKTIQGPQTVDSWIVPARWSATGSKHRTHPVSWIRTGRERCVYNKAFAKSLSNYCTCSKLCSVVPGRYNLIMLFMKT